jgi:two-component sensor histidine kinase
MGLPVPPGAVNDPAFLHSLLASLGDCIKMLDLDGRLIFMSRGGQSAMEVEDFGAVQHRPWTEFWEDEERPKAVAAVAAARAGEVARFTGMARTLRGAPRWWEVHVAPIAGGDGRPARLLVISRDVTAQMSAGLRQSALIELGDTLRDLSAPTEITMAAAAILGRALRAGRAAYARMADGGLAIGRNWTGEGLSNLQGLVRREDFGDAFDRLAAGEVLSADDVVSAPGMVAAVGPVESSHIRSLMAAPVILAGRLHGALLVHDTLPRAWGATERDFARGVADRCAAALAKAEAEEHQAFLNAELGHRMKNILAMAQAIALQTMRVSTDVATATEVLSGRLSALGKAHDILLGHGHSGGNMRSIVEGALRMHDDRRPDRFQLRGPYVQVGHRAGLPLALVVHELATNAAKYGALSSEHGTVDIDWTVKGAVKGAGQGTGQEAGQGAEALAAPEPVLVLRWTERGGPEVTVPDHRGFGTRLIERGLAGQVGGVTTLDYAPGGLVCTIQVSLAGLQAQD